MDKKQLFKAAKSDWDTALNLIFIIDEIGANVKEIIELYAIMKQWCDKFEKEIEQAKSSGDAEAEEDCTRRQLLFSGYVNKYEENVLKEFRQEIRRYFKLKEIVGYTKDELWAAKILVASAEKLEGLADENLKQFLPE